MEEFDPLHPTVPLFLSAFLSLDWESDKRRK